jgi:hypothetical protein
MAVGAYLRSPVALAWTLGGAIVVGIVAGPGAYAAAMVRTRTAAVGPTFLGGLGDLLYLVVVCVVLGVVVLVWLPFGAGVALAVGRRTRGQTASGRSSITAVLDALPAMLRWVKTRTAVPGLGEYVLSEDDVAPTEVVTGCEPYVVPALVLDAPTSLEQAVDRANRVTPRSGRERTWAAALGGTLVAAAGGYAGGTLGDVGVTGTALAVGVLTAGLVVTAALDAAWRAETYASQDLEAGFLGQ